MQQPLIRFKGKDYKVLNVNWRDGKPVYAIALIEGQAVEFYDSFNTDYLKNESGILINLDNCLVSKEENKDKLVESIKRKIEAHEEVVCDMSIEFVESFRSQRKNPFANNSLLEEADMIEKLGYVIDGLYEALNVVLQKELE